MTTSAELTAMVDACDEHGQLNPAAVGWSRRPLHTCNLRGHWPRKRRWDHWWVVNPDAALAVTCADLDYLRLGALTLFDFRSQTVLSHEAITLLPLELPSTPAGRDILFDRGNVRIAIAEEPAFSRTRLVVSGRTSKTAPVEADLTIRRSPDQQSLNVLVPFGTPSRFQFTSKQGALPASGALEGARRAVQLAGAVAYLDFGRGVWPWKVGWNWAAASGVTASKHVALQLGARWTDGTGQTENGVFTDGVLRKIGDDLRFHYRPDDLMRPWTIVTKDRNGSPRMRLEFQPVLARKQRMLTVRLHLCFGRFNGWVVLDDDERLEIHDLFGWAEDFSGVW